MKEVVMISKSIRYVPLVVTVGQVAIFPYYILWLKQVSLTFTLFAWLFAAFSFSSAWGYRTFQPERNSLIPLTYIGMGIVYIIVGSIQFSLDYLPYIALFLQIILGFLQGYFRAWHVKQKTYHVDAVNHYIIVGFVMVGLSFVKIISPVVFIMMFGGVLVLCGIGAFISGMKME